jgi:hypothetical protein
MKRTQELASSFERTHAMFTPSEVVAAAQGKAKPIANRNRSCGASSKRETFRRPAQKIQTCGGEYWGGGIDLGTEFINGYQFVYAWQSKFQSISLCPVDAWSPILQTSSLLQEEGGYEK